MSDSFKHLTGKQWAVGGAVGLAVGGVMVLLRRRNGNDVGSIATTDVSGATAVVPYKPLGSVGTVGGYVGSGSSPSTNIVGGTTDSKGSAAGITTNEQWRAEAARYLISNGYTSAAIDSAVGKYLGEIPLNRTDRSVIDKIFASVGIPPFPPRFVADEVVTPTLPTIPNTVTTVDRVVVLVRQIGKKAVYEVSGNVRVWIPNDATLVSKYGSNAASLVREVPNVTVYGPISGPDPASNGFPGEV